MNAAADPELLRRYAAEKSEAAFAELVRRHINFVYAASLRRLGGDSHLAEDVTQQVFAALGRDAASLARHPVLAGWLYTTTRFIAAQTVRSERRRRTREREAFVMNEILSDAVPVHDWERLRPEIDGAMDQLGDRDREAVLLRFFGGNSFGEIGARLRLDENAARMRVDRALDKMQAALAKRGVTSTAAALGLALANQAGVAAPAGLAAAVTGGVLAGAGSGTVGAMITFMSMKKIGIAAAILAAGGAAGVLWQRQASVPLEREIGELRRQNQEAARLRVENEELKKSSTALAALPAGNGELANLRNEVAALKKESPRPRASAPGSAPAPGGAAGQPPPLVPATQFRNAGNATPHDAGMTLAWALQNGDVDLAASLIRFEPAARAKMEALVAGLPENIRAQYDTPEKLLAFAAAGGRSKLVGVQVLSETEEGPDDLGQRAQLLYRNGKMRTEDLRFHRESDGWHQVFSMKSVERTQDALQEALGSVSTLASPSTK